MTAALRSLCYATLVVFLAASLPELSSLQAQSLGGGKATKENLDLPYDALGAITVEIEVPEIVTFYDTQHEGDGFFYVIDKSSSMASGELEVAKQEVIKNISEFSERVCFGIVFFDANLTRFPSSGQAAQASSAMKASAINFVMATEAGRGSCCQAGLSAALRMANGCPARRCVIIYLGDGGGHCSGGDEAAYHKQTLAAVAAQNYKRNQINTIGILDVQPHQEQFLRSLANSNGGTYTRINKR